MQQQQKQTFMFVFHGGAIAEQGVSPTDLAAHLAKWRAWVGELAAKGHAESGGHPLQSAGKTIRGKSKVVTDGPFAESKDMVTGNLIITASSLDEATQIALGCPVYEYDGAVEVRAVLPRG